MSSIVKFEALWGAGSETPHCYLLTVDDFTFMLDCGWDEKFDKDYVDRITKIAPRIDCLLLSFPDPLHLGALPYLVGKCQLSCPIYATIPVHKNGHLFMYDWYQSHYSYDEFDQFTLDDVDEAFDQITTVKFNQSVSMRGKGLGMNVSALPAGHMIGGTMWRICRDGEDDILYAVDYNHKKERHLGGCELDKIFRPSLLITDAINATYRPERRRQRDQKFVCQLQETCRRGGNVLIATDTGGRVLEICHLLEQMWSTRESGLSAYTLAVLSNTSYHVMHGARQMIEWMSEKMTKSFDTNRANPFSFKFIKYCHTLSDLNQLPSPKVVLASFPDLECGFSRELFMQWAPSSKNSIILTMRTSEGTLARRLIDNPSLGAFKLMEKKRVLLEGEELEEHLATIRQHKQMEKIKEHTLDSSDDDSDAEELTLLAGGKHDIICVSEKSSGSTMRSLKHHPMFPYHESKLKMDEYGEPVNHAEFERLFPDQDALEGNGQEIKGVVHYGNTEADVPEAPSKIVSQQVSIRVEAQVHFVDFEGRSDGESITKIIEGVSPNRIILVRGSSAALFGHAATLRTICPQTPIHTPVLGEVIHASTYSHMQQVHLSDPLLRSLHFMPAVGGGGKGVEVAWLEGVTCKKRRMEEEGDQVVPSTTQTDGEDILMVEAPDENLISPHVPVIINDVKLSDFKQLLAKAGIMCEFNDGVLWCANGTVALKKQEAGNVAIEGALTEDYFTIRDLLYEQFALI